MTRLALALSTALVLAACDPVERLRNDHLLAGVLVEAPAVMSSNPPLELQPAAGATVFFGVVDPGAHPTDAGSWNATGLAGADVTLSWAGGSATLAAVPGIPGQYAAVSGIAYTPGAAYTFRVAHGGETYSGTVTAPERPAMQHPQGTALPLVQDAVPFAAIPDPYALHRTGTSKAFYTVTNLSSASGRLDLSSPTCTNAPDLANPLDVLRLFFDDAEWRAASFDLPRASCFPEPAALAYALLLTAVNETGGAGLSSNLFLGSGVVAGSTAASVLPIDGGP